MNTDRILAGRYRMLKPLGQGGMGTVFAAHDLHLHNRSCVVKKLREDFCKELGDENALNYFQREARTLSRLHHPNVVQITDFFEDGGDYYLIMEYVEGKNLQQLVQQQGPFTPVQVIDWSMQICGVLEYLHEHEPPIIYRDLKPSNLMIDINGVLKLVDFGIARQYEVQNENTQVISAGYSSPEQYGGRADPRSDIYALGATMYFLLTGTEPVPLTVSEPGSAQLNMPGAIERIVKAATCPDPDLRFQTAYAMRQALLVVALPNAVPMPASWTKMLAAALIFAATLACIGYLAVRHLH